MEQSTSAMTTTTVASSSGSVDGRRNYTKLLPADPGPSNPRKRVRSRRGPISPAICQDDSSDESEGEDEDELEAAQESGPESEREIFETLVVPQVVSSPSPSASGKAVKRKRGKAPRQRPLPFTSPPLPSVANRFERSPTPFYIRLMSHVLDPGTMAEPVPETVQDNLNVAVANADAAVSLSSTQLELFHSTGEESPKTTSLGESGTASQPKPKRSRGRPRKVKRGPKPRSSLAAAVAVLQPAAAAAPASPENLLSLPTSPTRNPPKITKLKLVVRHAPLPYTNPAQRPPKPKHNSSLSEFVGSYYTTKRGDEVTNERFAQQVEEETALWWKIGEACRFGALHPGAVETARSVLDKRGEVVPFREFEKGGGMPPDFGSEMGAWGRVVEEVVAVGGLRARMVVCASRIGSGHVPQFFLRGAVRRYLDQNQVVAIGRAQMEKARMNIQSIPALVASQNLRVLLSNPAFMEGYAKSILCPAPAVPPREPTPLVSQPPPLLPPNVVAELQELFNENPTPSEKLISTWSRILNADLQSVTAWIREKQAPAADFQSPSTSSSAARTTYSFRGSSQTSLSPASDTPRDPTWSLLEHISSTLSSPAPLDALSQIRPHRALSAQDLNALFAPFEDGISSFFGAEMVV